MTTVVSRAYKDVGTAKAVAAALTDANHPARDMDMFAPGDADLAARLAAAKVDEGSIDAYVDAIEAGHAVVVARAEITPFGAARRAKEICDSFDPVPVEGAVGDRYISTTPIAPQAGRTSVAAPRAEAASIRTDHPLFLTGKLPPHRYFSSNFGWKLLSDRKPNPNNIYRGKKFFTDGWAKLLSDRKPREGLVMKDHPHMSQRFWPAPLLSKR